MKAGDGVALVLTSEPKHRLCWPIADVRPVAPSWSCLNTFERAEPLPSSSIDRVSTPTIVLFPESTFPMTATRTSRGRQPSPGRWRNRTAAGFAFDSCVVALAPFLASAPSTVSEITVTSESTYKAVTAVDTRCTVACCRCKKDQNRNLGEKEISRTKSSSPKSSRRAL